MQIPDSKNPVDQEAVLTKRQIEQVMVEFSKMVRDKTLLKNKSLEQKNTETDVVKRLLVLSSELDGRIEGHGTYSLFALIIRQLLLLRDENNELSFKVDRLEKENRKLIKQKEDLERAGK